MSQLKGALNLLLTFKGTPVVLSRPGTAFTASIKISPSNYARNLEVTNQIVSSGREFVISKEILDSATFPAPKRGDKIVHAQMGTMTISDIVEMYDIGGEIMAYRVRTN